MPEEALDLIEAFCRIKIRQYTQPLTPAEHAEGQRMEGWLRSLIDGAPAPARAPTAARPPAAEQLASAEGPAPLPLDAAMRELTGPLDAPAKPRPPVEAAELPSSGYTPPAVHGYLADYFSEDLQPAEFSSGVVHGAVDAEGAPVQLSEEQRALYGIGEAPPARRVVEARQPSREVSAAAPRRVVEARQPSREVSAVSPRQVEARQPSRDLSAAAPSSGRSTAPAGGFTAERAAGSPTVVHLLDGGVLRGMVRRFDPAEGAVEVYARGRTEPQRVELSALMAAFFGPGSYAEPEGGVVVAARLENGREVSGLSPDYTAEAAHFTLRPSDLRGNVARIWVSRAAVAELKTRPVQG